ncbi:MAG: Patatin [Acidimicrobiales bacterium]|nr:Patatin [Acidimicrobiales bacterium]
MPRLRDMLRRRPPRTAFVLSGGGNLGALQVGMLRALFERRIKPDVVLGCSVGALNGAAIAADPSLAMVGRLQDLWQNIAEEDVMPAGLLPATMQLARRGLSMHDNHNLRRVIEEILTTRTFEELTVPFQCVAADLLEGHETWFSQGALIDPILASAALPAVYPPVEINGVRYLDGAIVNDVPVSRAVELEADIIYVLHVGSWDRPRPEPKRPIDMAMYAYWLARRSRFRRDLASIPTDIEVIVLPPGGTPSIRYNDFGHSDEMIAASYRATCAFLDARDGPGRDDIAAAVPTVRPEERPDASPDEAPAAPLRERPPLRPPFWSREGQGEK